MTVDRSWRTAPPELWVLSALALLTRSWRLFSPGARVWDEVHFEEFASRYFSGSYYVDVHPPLGKLLFALAAWIAGVPAAAFTNAASAPQLRLVPALAGALLIPTFWWFLRELGASRKVALLGAALALLDNGLLVQSRFVLMDMVLLWFGLASVTLFLAARRSDGVARWGWLAGSAVLAGAAAATKWTGLSALGLIGLTWLLDAWRRGARVSLRRTVAEGALLAALPVAVYLGSFAVHFALLPNDGIGVRMMSPAFAATRHGNPAFRADAKLSFVSEVVELHGVMMRVHREIATVAQPAASPWYTWPIAKHRIQFWVGVGDTNGDARHIELLGNPVLWYGILGVLALFAAALALGRVRAGPQRGALAFLAVGYVMNYAPFAFITRPMYLYHYNTAWLFSAALAVFALGILTGWQNDDGAPWMFASRRARALYVGAFAAVVCSFVFFAPLSYGWQLDPNAMARRTLLLERH